MAVADGFVDAVMASPVADPGSVAGAVDLIGEMPFVLASADQRAAANAPCGSPESSDRRRPRDRKVAACRSAR